MKKLSHRKISVNKEGKEKKEKKGVKEEKEIKEEKKPSPQELERAEIEISLRTQFQELLIPFIAKIDDLNIKYEQQCSTVNIINRKIGELLFKYSHIQKQSVSMEDLSKKLEKIVS